MLAIRLTNSWGLTTTKRFCAETNQHISLELSAKWGLIADLSHWCLHSGDACDLLYAHHKACIRQGLTHQALILPKSSLKRWRIKAFTGGDYSVKTCLADNEYDAVNWLRSNGFKFSGFSSQLKVI